MLHSIWFIVRSCTANNRQDAHIMGIFAQLEYLLVGELDYYANTIDQSSYTRLTEHCLY